MGCRTVTHLTYATAGRRGPAEPRPRAAHATRRRPRKARAATAAPRCPPTPTPSPPSRDAAKNIVGKLQIFGTPMEKHPSSRTQGPSQASVRMLEKCLSTKIFKAAAARGGRRATAAAEGPSRHGGRTPRPNLIPLAPSVEAKA